MAGPPDGLSVRFAPLSPHPGNGVLRAAIAVRGGTAGDPDSALVLLRSGCATRVYLGANIDAAGRVIEWLEVWVQTVGGLAGSATTWRDQLSNALLDRQWTTEIARFAARAPDLMRHAGWETTHPEPLFIDRESTQPWQPVDPNSQRGYRLCVDDALLTQAGLPAYSSSLHRYLYAQDDTPEQGTTWIAATPGAPTPPGDRDLATLLPDGRALVPLNPEGGLMHLRRFSPLGLEGYADLLSGQPWPGLDAGPEIVRLGPPYDRLDEWDHLLQEPGSLWLHGRGRMSALAETFHLRVQIIQQLVTVVARTVAQTQLPLLNLTADSFRVELAAPAPSLPLLWSARAILAAPGAAVALPVPGSDIVHYLPLNPPHTTIYRPDFLGWPVRGRARVRLRRVAADTAGLITIEGTLVTSERLTLSPRDLVWIKLPLAGGLLDVFAHVDQSEGLAAGESRFRTEPQRQEPQTLRALRAAEGNAYDGTEFETIPMLSTPCDLYALGVLAVRALLVNGHNSLSIALDEVLSLARELGGDDDASDPVARTRTLVANDPRWRTSLGAHRLAHERLDADAIAAVVPEDLWWQAVTLVARLFPGGGPAAYCRDFADVPPTGLERVFAQPLADLQKLLLRTRGLLFSDWGANREVAAVLTRLHP